MQTTLAAAPESLLAASDQVTQTQMTAEIRALHAEYERREEAGEALPRTMHDFPPYRSSILRHPTKNPKLVDPETIELLSPAFGQRDVAAIESDLTDPARRGAAGRADDGRAAGCSTRDGQAGREPAHRAVAGELRRPVHPQARPAPGAARSELHRCRAGAHRRRRRRTGSPRSSPGRTRGRTTSTRGGPRTSISRCSAPRSPSGWSPRCTSRATRCSRSTRSTSRSPTTGPATASSRPTTTTSPCRSGRSATAGTSSLDGSDATWIEPEEALMTRSRTTRSRRPARPSARSSRYGAAYTEDASSSFPHAPGAILLAGTVLDGAGEPIPDALHRDLRQPTPTACVPRARGLPPRRPHLHRLRTRVHRRRRPLRVLDPQPGATAAPERRAVLRGGRLRARPAGQAAHAHLPPGADDALPADPLLRADAPPQRATLSRAPTADGILPPRHPPAGGGRDGLPCLLRIVL